MIVPHTFGGDLKFNTHLHVLVSAGGLRESEGRWIPRLQFNKNSLMLLWRYAVITHLRAALKADVLNSDSNKQDLQTILTTAYERHPVWIIHIAKIVSKSHFLGYAARYIRRPPIAGWRLLKVTNREVEFVAKDTKAKRLVRTRCHLVDFVRRLAEHVPENHRWRFAILAYGLPVQKRAPTMRCFYY